MCNKPYFSRFIVVCHKLFGGAGSCSNFLLKVDVLLSRLMVQKTGRFIEINGKEM